MTGRGTGAFARDFYWINRMQGSYRCTKQCGFQFHDGRPEEHACDCRRCGGTGKLTIRGDRRDSTRMCPDCGATGDAPSDATKGER